MMSDKAFGTSPYPIAHRLSQNSQRYGALPEMAVTVLSVK